jgi:hypothetical protein
MASNNMEAESQLCRVMKALLKLPIDIHAGFLHACPLVSREYEILKNSLVRESPTGQSIVEILCESTDVKLLLEPAKECYSDALPYIKEL